MIMARGKVAKGAKPGPYLRRDEDSTVARLWCVTCPSDEGAVFKRRVVRAGAEANDALAVGC